MSHSHSTNNTLLEAVSKVDEIVRLMLDSYDSADQRPTVEQLERIVRSVDLKMRQLNRAVEAGDEDQAVIIIRRIFKKVSRFYRVF